MKNIIKVIIIGLTLLSLNTYSADVKVFDSASIPYQSEVVFEDLNNPWAVVSSPDGDLYITEKKGQIKVVRNRSLKFQLKGIPSDLTVCGQGGLLDLAFHPDFKNNSFIYLSYITKTNVKPTGGVNTRISRFKLVNRVLTNEKVLVQGGFGNDCAHFGSRITFGKNGKIYASIGERHNKEKAQNLKYLNGKIIRINDDGSIPSDNPFSSKPNAKKQIYSLGHRNPQGIATHPDSGLIVISEHGPTFYDANNPKTGASVGDADEINIIKSGHNYGWPTIFGKLTKVGFTSPLREYTPGPAPSGVAFYTGDQFPSWKNDLFVSSLKGRSLLRIKVSIDEKIIEEETLIASAYGRIRDVTTGADGFIYVISDNGKLIKLSPISK
jgi:glucose/arabinose dehydrogenase